MMTPTKPTKKIARTSQETQPAGRTSRSRLALTGALILGTAGLCAAGGWQLAKRPEHRHAALDLEDAPARPEPRHARHDFVPRPPPLFAPPSAPSPAQAPQEPPRSVAQKDARRSFIEPVVSSGPAPNAKWVADARGVLEHLGADVDTNGHAIELSKVQCFGGGCMAEMVLDADSFNSVDEKLLSGGAFAFWPGVKQRSPLEQRPDGRIVTNWILLPPS